MFIFVLLVCETEKRMDNGYLISSRGLRGSNLYLQDVHEVGCHEAQERHHQLDPAMWDTAVRRYRATLMCQSQGSNIGLLAEPFLTVQVEFD